MTITEIHRQPAPDIIGTPEQALRVYLLDPTPDAPPAVYARAYFEGYLTGIRWRHGCHDEADVAAHDRLNGSQSWGVRPVSLPGAVEACRPVRTSADELKFVAGAGWLAGFAAALDGAPDTSTCAVCQRLILLDVDDHGYCQRDGVHGCRWHMCTGHAECAE